MSHDRQGVWVDLGRMPYGDAWALQRRLVEARIAGAVPDTVLFVEHPPVITLGRKVRDEARGTLAGVPVFEVERGGDLTYHGDGQLVAYPIVALGEGRSDIGRYLRALEAAVIDAIARFGLSAQRRAPHTGVWVGERKVASIGVALRSWVTYHGLAINVTDAPLEAFRKLVPCGLPGAVMTSLAQLAAPSPPPSLPHVQAALIDTLASSLDLSLQPQSLAGLTARLPNASLHVS